MHHKRKLVMIRILLFVVIIPIVKICEGQNLKGVKSITLYENSIVQGITLIDTNGNITFSKSRSNGTTFICANFYDHLNRKTKTISGQSDEDFDVRTFEFSNLENTIQVYAYKKIPEKEKFKQNNYLLNIEKYTSANDLEIDPAVLSIINNGKKYIDREYFLNLKGDTVKEIWFEENGDTTAVDTYKFNDYGKIVYHIEFSKQEENFYFIYDSKGNEILSIRVNGKGDTIEEHQFKYNRINQQIENKYLTNGKIAYIEKKYYLKGKIIKEKHYHSTSSLIYETSYVYDNTGHVLKRKIYYIEENKVDVLNWKYEYY